MLTYETAVLRSDIIACHFLLLQHQSISLHDLWKVWTWIAWSGLFLTWAPRLVVPHLLSLLNLFQSHSHSWYLENTHQKQSVLKNKTWKVFWCYSQRHSLLNLLYIWWYERVPKQKIKNITKYSDTSRAGLAANLAWVTRLPAELCFSKLQQSHPAVINSCRLDSAATNNYFNNITSPILDVKLTNKQMCSFNLSFVSFCSVFLHFQFSL